MENQIAPNTSPKSDEIDLKELFRMIGRGFQNLFRVFLRLFVYLRRNIIKLGILGVIGLAIGFGLNQIVAKKQKTEVIVKPNLESKNYLYDVVNEIQANIKAKDSSFFGTIGIDVQNLKGFEITVTPVEDKNEEGNIEDDIKYLELLEKFENDDLVTDVARTEILNRSSLNHRITFYYKNTAVGNEYSRKLMDYINSNDYFNELGTLNRENAEERIKQNTNLVVQIDGLVRDYSEKMSKSNQMGEGRIVLDTEDKLDITGLLGLKNGLIRDIERKKVEIQGQKESIRVLNFGNSQEVQKPFFGKNIVLIPLILFGLFFLIDLFKYFNRKAKEMEL